jgi:hypothetical protein
MGLACCGRFEMIQSSPAHQSSCCRRGRAKSRAWKGPRPTPTTISSSRLQRGSCWRVCGLSARGIAGAIRYAVLVPTMSGRGKDCELRLALEPAHILFMARNGRSIDQRDPGTCRPQDNHHVCPVQPSLARTQALSNRAYCHSASTNAEA